MDERPSFPFGAWLVVSAIAASALALTGLVEQHTSDSLIFTLASLDHWTVFFWEQDRVGMLIPTLTSFIEHPFAVLMVQTGLVCFFGLTFPAVLARLVSPNTVGAVAALLANVWFLLAAPILLHENQFIVCMYSTGLFLGVCSLLVLEPRAPLARWRWPVAVLLMALAMWTYIAVVIVLFPLSMVLGRWRALRGALSTLTGFAIGWVLMQTCDNVPPFGDATRNETLPWPAWVVGTRKLIEGILELPGGTVWLGSVLGAGLLALIVTLLRWRRHRDTLRAAAILLMMAVVEIGFCASRRWTSDNLFHPRYLIAGITAVPLATALLILNPFAAWFSRRASWQLLAFGLITLIIAGVIRHGVPSSMRAREIIDQKFGAHSQAVLDSKAQAVGGRYWTLWTTSFHVRLLQYERGDSSRPVPVGWRSWCYRDEWLQLPKPFVVAVPRGEFEETNRECILRGLEPLTKIGDAGSVELYVTQPSPAK